MGEGGIVNKQRIEKIEEEMDNLSWMHVDTSKGWVICVDDVSNILNSVKDEKSLHERVEGKCQSCGQSVMLIVGGEGQDQ